MDRFYRKMAKDAIDNALFTATTDPEDDILLETLKIHGWTDQHDEKRSCIIMAADKAAIENLCDERAELKGTDPPPTILI